MVTLVYVKVEADDPADVEHVVKRLGLVQDGSEPHRSDLAPRPERSRSGQIPGWVGHWMEEWHVPPQKRAAYERLLEEVLTWPGVVLPPRRGQGGGTETSGRVRIALSGR